jgi:hypothetical protein
VRYGSGKVGTRLGLEKTTDAEDAPTPVDGFIGKIQLLPMSGPLH